MAKHIEMLNFRIKYVNKLTLENIGRKSLVSNTNQQHKTKHFHNSERNKKSKQLL